MKKKILIPIMMAFVFVAIGFLKLHPPQATDAADSADKTVLKIQLKQTQNNAQTYQIEYDYKNNNPVIVLSSHQFKNIDIPFLVDQFDKENVGINEQNQQIFLNLKKFKQSNGSFQLRKLGEDPLLLNIRNAKNELLYQSKIDSDMKEPTHEETTSHTEIQPAETNVAYNNLEAPSTEVDNNQLDEDTTEESTNTDKNIIDDSAQSEIPRDPDWDRGWSEREKLLVARGIEKKLPTGRTSMPVQYFGALNYALTNTGVYDSVKGRPLRPGLILPGPSRGTGRKNNLTAANSAIITYRPGHHWTEAQVDDDDDYRLNYYLNYTFGDGLLYTDGWFNDAEDKAYRGSQRNFITTNLFDYYLPTGDISKPRIYGPDFEEKDVWGIDEHNVHYYIKNDKLYRDGNPNNKSSKNVVETIKQRLVFRQVMKNTIVQVTITMRFDNNNASIITTEFKNIGTTYIDNFQGYTFRDITFLYNHKRKGSKQDNIIRSLGNHVGAYASRNDKFNSRIEFKLNGYPDSPYAWSARGTRSTFYQAYDGDHFPWNFKGLNNQYDDAFTDIYDRGDRDREPSFGKPFMDFATDSGISMHTKNQPLLPGQKVAMTYSTNIIQKDDVPLLDLTNAEENSKENPKVIPYLSNNAEITGTWLYDRMHDVNVKYVIEDADIKHKDENEFAKHIMQNGVSVTKGFQNQSLADMHNRVKHPWTAKIPFNELGTGLRKVTFVAYDKENKCSKLKTYYILIPEQTEVKNFEIQVMTPESSTEPGFPYDPRKDQQHVDKLTITGYSTDLTHNHQIEYQLDGGEKKPVDVHQQFKDKDIVYWGLRDLDLSNLKKDIGIHRIIFTLTDKDGKTTTDEFFFRYVMNASTNKPEGTFRILAPQEIDFGVTNMADDSTSILRPKISQNLVFDDQRQLDKRDETVKLTLSTQPFHLKEKNATKATSDTIDTDLLWNNRQLQKDIPYLITNDEQANRIVLNDIFLQNVRLKVDNDTPVKTGKFTSGWLWTASDSI